MARSLSVATRWTRIGLDVRARLARSAKLACAARLPTTPGARIRVGTPLASLHATTEDGFRKMTPRRIDHQCTCDDFVTHLRARLGLENEAQALVTLGNWLSSYEPGPAALARATPRPSQHSNAA